MKALLLSSLSKVFKDIEPNENEFTSFSSLKNENFSFQLAMLPEADSETEISVEVVSPIKDNIAIYQVRDIPAGTTRYEDSDNFHYPADRKEFPELLMPQRAKSHLLRVSGQHFGLSTSPQLTSAVSRKLSLSFLQVMLYAKRCSALTLLMQSFPSRIFCLQTGFTTTVFAHITTLSPAPRNIG